MEEAQIPKGRLHGRKPKKPLAKGAARLRGLVLVPTRELAFQVAQEAELLTKRLRFTVAVAVGKSPSGCRPRPSRMVLNSSWPPRVECGSWAKRGFSIGAIFGGRHRRSRSNDGHGLLPQIESLLSELPAGRQHLLFSATMPKQVERLSARFLTDPVRLEVDPEGSTAANLNIAPLRSPAYARSRCCWRRSFQAEGVLVFCRTRRRVILWPRPCVKLASPAIPFTVTARNRPAGKHCLTSPKVSRSVDLDRCRGPGIAH